MKINSKLIKKIRPYMVYNHTNKWLNFLNFLIKIGVELE